MTSADIQREILLRTNPFGLMRALLGAHLPEEFYQKLFESGMRHAGAALLERVADEVLELADREDCFDYARTLCERAKELRK